MLWPIISISHRIQKIIVSWWHLWLLFSYKILLWRVKSSHRRAKDEFLGINCSLSLHWLGIHSLLSNSKFTPGITIAILMSLCWLLQFHVYIHHEHVLVIFTSLLALFLWTSLSHQGDSERVLQNVLSRTFVFKHWLGRKPWLYVTEWLLLIDEFIIV